VIGSEQELEGENRREVVGGGGRIDGVYGRDIAMVGGKVGCEIGTSSKLRSMASTTSQRSRAHAHATHGSPPAHAFRVLLIRTRCWPIRGREYVVLLHAV
jgi:hypothetical protein